MDGWISLHRKVRLSAVWQDAELFRLWCLCLLKATHKPHKQMIGNQYIDLEPGQFVTGRDALAEEYNRDLSPSKKVKPLTLWRWLQKLEKLENLNIKPTNKYSVVTVVNWSEYQETEQQMNNKRTTNEQQMITNNNGNNNNNGNTKKNNVEAEASSPLFQQVQDIWNHYLNTFEGLFTRKPSLTPNRRKSIEQRLKDKHPENKNETLFSVDDIKLAISNIRQSSFHCGNNDNGKFYADITFLCRNASKVEDWMNFQPKPKQQKVIPLKAGVNNVNNNSGNTNEAPSAKPITKGKTGWLNRPKRYQV